MADLTIIYLTANRMPKRWVDFHLKHLLAAIGDYPLITVSRKPMDLGVGETKLIQTTTYCSWNTFREWNRAAKVAETEFVAIAEDDTLYHERHFSTFRPKLDEVAYDMSRWTVMSWHKERATFSVLRAMGGFACICPRQVMIATLDEREAKFPNGVRRGAGEIGRPEVSRAMGIKHYNAVQWWSRPGMVNMAHTRALSSTFLGSGRMKRKEGELQAIEIPYWGRAADIVEIFNRGCEEEPEEHTHVRHDDHLLH